MTSGKPESAAVDHVGFRPLYKQVKDAFVKRMVDGIWSPGALLPSESQLAQEFGVSQGTVRKALDEMEAENLIVRQQGKGTFVAQHDEERILFQFFKLVMDDGVPRFPESTVLEAGVFDATDEERRELELRPGAKVARVRRVRYIAGQPMIIETLALPDRMFPGITETDVPNSLYAYYADRFGVTIAYARERLKAVALSSADAAALDRAAGHPAIEVKRLAQSLDAKAVEWRISYYLTDEAHYLASVR